MRTNVTNYLNYISGLVAEYQHQAEILKSDERKDEANLYKIRMNICDIFYKMIDAADKKVAAMKLVKEEEQNKAFYDEYLNFFEMIPQNWKVNQELAQKHNDVIVVKTEEVKLETANLLRKKFLELYREEEV